MRGSENSIGSRRPKGDFPSPHLPAGSMYYKLSQWMSSLSPERPLIHYLSLLFHWEPAVSLVDRLDMKHQSLYVKCALAKCVTLMYIVIGGVHRSILLLTLFALRMVFIASCVVLPPPKPATSLQGLICPQLALLAAIAGASLFFEAAPSVPAQTQFTQEPVALCVCALMAQLVMAMRFYPLEHRLITALVFTSMHIVRPIFPIGWREPALLAMGNVTGFLCGLAINYDQHKLRSMIKLVAVHKRADSRLNRAVKGQYDRAAHLLNKLPELHPLALASGTSSKARILVDDIKGLLDRGSNW